MKGETSMMGECNLGSIRKALISVAFVVFVLAGCQTTEQCSLEKYGDISANAGSCRMSVQNAVHSMQDKRLAKLKTIIDVSVSGKRLTAAKRSVVL